MESKKPWKHTGTSQIKKNKKGDYMFNDFCEIIALVVCVAGILIGAALALAAGNNGNPVPAIIGIVICVISLIGVCFLEKPFMDVQKNLAESGTAYKAVHQDEIKSFVNCYKF